MRIVADARMRITEERLIKTLSRGPETGMEIFELLRVLLSEGMLGGLKKVSETIDQLVAAGKVTRTGNRLKLRELEWQ